MKPTFVDAIVRLSLRLMAPPPGVAFAVQRGKGGLLPPTSAGRDSLRFDLALNLGLPRADGSFDFVGEFAQGPRDDRFIYINSGQRAAQPDSPWDRRAKLKLADVPRRMVEASLAEPALAIQATLPGSMKKDGGPVCASLPADAVTWQLVPAAG